MQLVSPMLLPELMHTAVISRQFPLPDIVIHSVEQTMGWAADGVLNAALTDEIVDEIGRATFDPGALAWLAQNGQTAAIPLHGFNQIILYRADWYTEQGLAIPDNYAAMLAGAETFYNRENLTSGFIVPTESNLVTTHFGFEQIPLANGCQIFNDAGEVLLLDQSCQDALDFYYEIIHNYSPSGVQTDSSARRAYLAGRTGLIMTSPSILPLLAGLESDLLPTCAECASNISYLAQNSGILTQITGSGTEAAPANFGNMTVMGVTQEADAATAVAFAQYWFENAYTDWLAIETERKVPMRWGTADQPRQFIDNWGIIPLSGSSQSLMDIYGDEVIGRLRDDVTSTPRWGFRQGQGALMSDLFESLTLSVVLQEMLSGYFNPNQTIFEAYVRLVEFIPNYAFEVVPTPTPES
jgi:multiple sugar transport system substrate-binding protein